MRSSIDIMRSGELVNMQDPLIQESFKHAKTLLAEFNHLSMYSNDYRRVLCDLIPGIPDTSTIMPL